jgi:hypothetical protein
MKSSLDEVLGAVWRQTRYVTPDDKLVSIHDRRKFHISGNATYREFRLEQRRD